jgi:hypothetical protein
VRRWAPVALVSAVVLLAGVAWFNVEAYGGGPPYYGRTTNMDKWSDPVPVLLVVDGATLAVVAALLMAGIRGLRKP